MRLSDFGLCKPLDCSNLSPINENEVIDGEEKGSANKWNSSLEQMQHWQINRRKLVSRTLLNINRNTAYLITYKLNPESLFWLIFQGS